MHKTLQIPSKKWWLEGGWGVCFVLGGVRCRFLGGFGTLVSGIKEIKTVVLGVALRGKKHSREGKNLPNQHLKKKYVARPK